MPYAPLPAAVYLSNMIAALVGSGFTNFKEGSRNRTLLEAVALELAEGDQRTYQGYLQAIRESCYESFGFPLLGGNKSSGLLRVFHAGHASDFPVPEFQVELFGLNYLVQTATVIPVGQTHIDVDVVAEIAGAIYDVDALGIDTAEGKGNVDPAFGFDRIANLADITGGTDIESEESRELRWQNTIQNLAGSTLAGIEAGIKNVDGVVDAFVDENINPYTLLYETGWVRVFITDGTASPPPALIAEVQKVLDGDPADKANYPGLRAAGIGSWVGAIQTQAINLTFGMTVLTSCPLTDLEIEENATGAVQTYVNRLSQGNDVLLQHWISVILELRRNEYISVDTSETDIAVPGGYVPKIGGTGGGTITFTGVTREDNWP